ncbi:MAG: nucleotidyltransferase [Thermomicrobia bacterium]|nr:nucleotidyltransferase [Thermomicrobia bacterium]MCA1724449.1 nucleotidyltransferase [Thermomicrobia bacterium]
MYTLGTHFDELFDRIKPPDERLKAAKELPPQVRDFLEESKDFLTLAPHSRLVGSYPQGLSVGEVKDVDFLIRVDGKPEANEPEAKGLILDLRQKLDDLPSALGYDGAAGVDIAGARRSVHVYFEGRDFHLDVVPCIAPDGLDAPIYVPDRSFNTWIRSHPVGYIALLDELNGTHGGKVKRLIRLLKHFRNVQMKTRRPKSYWLGALALHHIRRAGGLDMSQPLAILFRDLLDAIYKQYASLLPRTDGATPNIKDPMLGHNISWNWDRAHFETFMRRLDDGRTWATNALDATDRETAIAWWQRIFGADYFPATVEERLASLAALGQPGKAIVTGTGAIVASKPTTGTSVMTRPTTFHGDAHGQKAR